MKTFIVSGSHRQNSQSSKVAHYFQSRIENLFKGSSTEVLDLGKQPMPLWDEEVGKTDAWRKTWTPVAQKIQEMHSLVVVSPEWSGMVPSALKNFFLLCGTKEIGHKPALIATVSASRGGAYPISELRASSYKNTRICYIPEHIIVRDCEEMLNDQNFDPEDSSKLSKSDFYLRKRIDYSLGILEAYESALKGLRETGPIDHKSYPNGMS